MKLDRQLPVEQFEANVSQSTVPSPLLQDVHRRIHGMRQARAEDNSTRAVARALAAEGMDVLVLDEFQITNISDALVVETLLSFLLGEGVLVVLSTNRPPGDLYKHGLNHHLAIPQLLALFERWQIAVHEMATSTDYRAAAAASEDGEELRDVILKGACAQADDGRAEARLREVFAEASLAPEGGAAERVPIAWGRALMVGEARGGVGRFTFQELCGGQSALGAEDYIRLALRFHTFLVTDVPPFSVDMHNEARRFKQNTKHTPQTIN